MRPLSEALCDADGRPSARTCAQALARAFAREAQGSPGALFEARCAPEVAAALAPLLPELGPRLTLRAQAGIARGAGAVVPR